MLEYLHIKRFKTLLDNGFELGNLNVFAGLNGMGKSSVIQMLLLLRQSHQRKLLFSRGLILKGDYLNLGTGRDVLSADVEDESIACLLKWKDTEPALDISFDYAPDADFQRSRLAVYLDLHEPKTDLDFALAYEDLALFNHQFQYLSAERLAPKTYYALSDFHINSLNTLGNQGEFTAHYLAEHKDMPLPLAALQHPAAPAQDLLSNLEAWMSEITPGIKIKVQKKPDMDLVSLNYAFVQGKQITQDYKPQNVGFGLTYVLPVLTALLRASQGDLLIFENPEAHLHPAAQAALGRLMALAAANGVQCWVETHSDHFLNGIRVAVKQGLIPPEQVKCFFLERRKDATQHATEVLYPRIDAEGRMDIWPEGFFDEWEKQLDQLL